MKYRSWLLVILTALSFSSAAAYQRNVARPVEQVVFGKVSSVRYFDQSETHQIHSQPWKTLMGAVVGGVIGNQFGGGFGRVVATGTGAAIGASIAHQPDQLQSIRYQLVELLIRTDAGKLLDVIQDYDPQMIFEKGQSVRVLYFKDGVRVDTTY